MVNMSHKQFFTSYFSLHKKVIAFAISAALIFPFKANALDIVFFPGLAAVGLYLLFSGDSTTRYSPQYPASPIVPNLDMLDLRKDKYSYPTKVVYSSIPNANGSSTLEIKRVPTVPLWQLDFSWENTASYDELHQLLEALRAISQSEFFPKTGHIPDNFLAGVVELKMSAATLSNLYGLYSGWGFYTNENVPGKKYLSPANVVRAIYKLDELVAGGKDSTPRLPKVAEPCANSLNL